MKSLRDYFLTKTKTFLKNKGGASAVEFALILPVMVVIYMSTVEISLAIAAQRRVAIAAGTVGDLAAQYETMNDTNIAIILGSSFAVLKPYEPIDMTVRVTSVAVDAIGTATVDWSYSQQRHLTAVGRGTGYVTEPVVDDGTKGSAYTLPAGMDVSSSSVIVANIDFTYTSPVGALLPSNKHFTQNVFFRPRLGQKIPFESGTPSASWSLPTSGPAGSQINPTYIGFGAEYELPVRDVIRTDSGSASLDSAPNELENAQSCEWSQPECNPGDPGGGGYGGGGGGGGGGGDELPLLMQ